MKKPPLAVATAATAVAITALALAGCGPAASGSLGPDPSGTATQTPSHPASATPKPDRATTPPVPASATSSAPATTTAPVAPPIPPTLSCSRESVLGGTFTVCPGSAPVGATVTISSDTACQANPGSEPTLVFLGPKAYIGSSGGGQEIPVTKVGKGFTATYRIPATYIEGGSENTSVPVTPGTGYSFATYPAAGCDTKFTVTP